MIGPVCTCVSVGVSVTKNSKTPAKEPFRQKGGLKADVHATCRSMFMFVCVLVLLFRRYIQLLLIIRSSCNMPYSFVSLIAAASVYYAVFFRVKLLLSAYYDSLVPDPGSRSRLQHLAHVRATPYVYDSCAVRGKCSMNTF